jgi:hypothetical protein
MSSDAKGTCTIPENGRMAEAGVEFRTARCKLLKPRREEGISVQV